MEFGAKCAGPYLVLPGGSSLGQFAEAGLHFLADLGDFLVRLLKQEFFPTLEPLPEPQNAFETEAKGHI